MKEVPHTEFTFPRELLMKIKYRPNFQWPPPPIQSIDHPNQTKYCQYHRMHGHHTNQCKFLRHYLEGLVQQGKLQQYVKNQLGQPPLLADKE